MDGSFACPECGNELTLKGLTPGRQVRCGWCETWVEVPFLPRAGEATRFRRPDSRGRRRIVWIWTGLAVAAVLILIGGAIRMVRVRERVRAERSLAALVASADEDEKAGQFESALEALDRAIAEARGDDSPGSSRIAALQEQRDRVARRGIQARLALASRAAPEQSIADSQRLLAQAQADPALAEFVEPIREQLDRSRVRVVEIFGAAARRDFDRGRYAEALDLYERMSRTAEDLAPDVRSRVQKDANALVAQIVESRGVLIEPIQGSKFALGSLRSYTDALLPVLGASLRHRGYVPRPPDSSWGLLWTERAPYRAKVEVSEVQEGSYYQSTNRPTVIEATAVLSRRGAPIWQERIVVRSRLNLSKLSGYQESRVELSKQRDPQIERALYDDAHAQLMDRFLNKVRALPECQPDGLGTIPTAPAAASK